MQTSSSEDMLVDHAISVCHQKALELMSIVAVVVNCVLIGTSDLSNRMFPDISAAERIVYIVILEVSAHICIA